MEETEKIRQLPGRIINIQHYCYQDGPGVRTTVFVKGCSLRCRWCGNPESIHGGLELSFDPKECVGCENCNHCEKLPFVRDLFVRKEAGPPDIRWENAKNWDVENNHYCPAGALSVYGKDVTVGQVMDEVDQDYSFYMGNKGGITVSGGEPLLQPEFTRGLLEMSHSHGFTTAIESAFCVPRKNVDMVLPHVDTVLHDIKMMDEEKHKYWTGVSNSLILENLDYAYRKYADKTFIARTPIIPTVNDSLEEIDKILDFILQYPNVLDYEIMPYHRLGTGKYESLGKEYKMGDLKPPSKNQMEQFRNHIKKRFMERRSNEHEKY